MGGTRGRLQEWDRYHVTHVTHVAHATQLHVTATLLTLVPELYLEHSGAQYELKVARQAEARFKARELEGRMMREQVCAELNVLDSHQPLFVVDK